MAISTLWCITVPCLTTPTIVGNVAFTKTSPEEGEDTSATCQWEGSPEPIGRWLKDGVELVEGALPGRIRITGTQNDGLFMSELQIQDVELGDSGTYTCNISNPVDFDYRVTRLEVRGMM